MEEEGKRKVIRKGDSKILRQQTGYNVKTKKIMDQVSKQEEEIQRIKKDLEKYTGENGQTDRVNSGIAHKPNADWDSRKNRMSNDDLNEANEDTVVTEEDIKDSLSHLRLLLQVFEDNACKFLFTEKYLVSYDDSVQAFANKLQLSSSQANKVTLFIFKQLGHAKNSNKSITMNKRDFIEKVELIVGKYKRYGFL